MAKGSRRSPAARASPQQRLIPLCCARIADEVASGSGMDPEAPDQADRTLTWFQTILHHAVKFAYACTCPSRCTWDAAHARLLSRLRGRASARGAAVLPYADDLIAVLRTTLALPRRPGQRAPGFLLHLVSDRD